MAETKDLPPTETRNLPSYDPEEANRELRAMLRENLQEGRKDHKERRVLMWCQVVGAFATAAALFSTALMVLLTRQQVDAVREATQQAQEQFNRTIQQAQEQFNLSQRPWIASTAINITDFEIGKKPQVTVTLANKGLTPAIMKTQFYMGIEPELPKEFLYPSVPHTSTVILLPDSSGTAPHTFRTEISEEIMKKLYSGELVFYVYGFVEYKDPRGNTYDPTQFCAFWKGEKKTLTYCDTHNTVK